MGANFLDSSALVKRYIDEQGTPVVIRLMTESDSIVVSRLAWVEVTSACARRVRARLMTDDQFEQVALVLEREIREVFEVIELGGAVMNRAVQLARSRALRAADAIQLACAQVACGERAENSSICFVSADQELNEAARSEGMIVLDPRTN